MEHYENTINLFKAVMNEAIHDLEISKKDFGQNGKVRKIISQIDEVEQGAIYRNRDGYVIRKDHLTYQILALKKEYIENNNFFYSKRCKELCGYIDLDYDFLIETLRKRNLLNEKDFEPAL